MRELTMFDPFPPRASRHLLWGLTLVSIALLMMTGTTRVLAQPPQAKPAAAASFNPDAAFLREEPYRKTKQVVRLSGVKSEAELAIVKAAMNDVVRFVRLFGVTGSNLGDAVIPGTPPERMAEIKAARVTWRAFEAQSTPAGRAAMPIEPASGHMVVAMDDWLVESQSALSVRTDFRMTQFELKMVTDPVPRVMRLRFVKREGVWLLDGATPVQ
jgi:hypothetical protein